MTLLNFAISYSTEEAHPAELFIRQEVKEVLFQHSWFAEHVAMRWHEG